MGKKDNCAIRSVEGFLENQSSNFENDYNKIIEKFPNLKDSAAVINQLYNSYLNIDPMLADAFGAWTKDRFADHIYESGITAPIAKKDLTADEIAANVMAQSVSETYTDIHDISEPHLDQDFKDGDHVDYNENENQASTTVNMKKDAGTHFKNRIFKAIGKPVSKKEFAEISDKASKLTFEEFLDYIIDKYPDVKKVDETAEANLLSKIFGEVALDKIQDPLKLKALKRFHNFNKPENRVSREDKKYYVIANWDGEKPLPKGSVAMTEKPKANLKTKKEESDYLPVSFIDESGAILPSGKKVGEVTSYMSLNDMVELTQDNDGNWYARDIHADYSYNQLVHWLKIMLDQKGLTIATLRGGNSGTIVLTKVEDNYYDLLISPEVLKSYEAQIPSKFLKLLKENDYKFNVAFKKWGQEIKRYINKHGVSKIKDLVQIYNQMEEFQRKLSIKAFNDYLNKEVELGNITPEDRIIFLKNIKELPVSGKYNKVTGMKEVFIGMQDFLASIIARHEWLKAVRGNKYVINENLENIFNRMRLAASEGLVNLKGSNKQLMIIDESQVYYRNTETGEKIEPLQNIKGMKDKVAIDDGQMDIDSETMNEYTSSIGAEAVMPYEHNPKEIKQVTYHIEQNTELDEDGKQLPDDYVEVKSMSFLAEPNMEIVDKKTGKVIVSYSSRTDELGNTVVEMYAGPGSDMPGQRVNKVATLNEAKTMMGKYKLNGASNIIQEIPASATRTIILPSNKSHNDSAMGTGWANSFNINEPIYNEIRRMLIDFYLSILDSHLNLLHNVRQNPTEARKVLKYQTKIRDDATTAVQEFYAMSEKGIHHPNNWKIFIRSLFNSIVLNDGMMARLTIDKTNPRKMSDGASSSMKLKQDKKGRIKLKEDGEPEGWIIGANNDRFLNYVSDIYLKGLSQSERSDFLNLPLSEKIVILNNYLDKNEILANGVRQPVQHVGGSIIRRIIGFTEDAGDALIAHPQDVTFNWIGDGDGDTVNIILFPNQEFTKKLAKLLKDPGLTNMQDASSDLNIFEHAPTTHPGSYVGFVDTMLSAIKNFNGQGIVTNLKTVASVLELKLGDNPIVLSDGTQINIIKAKDFVVMDYAPLKNEVTEKDIPEFASIVNQDGTPWDGKGKKYLKTTAHHERLMLLNAATDNTKEHLIGKMWKMNLDTIITRVYKRSDGKPFTPEQIQLLKKVNRYFNYSPLRNGRDKKTRNKLEDNSWYGRTKSTYDFLNGDNEYQLGVLNTFIQGKFSKLSIKEMTISKELTVDEAMLIRPYEKMIEDSTKADKSKTSKSWGPTSRSPLRYTNTKIQNTHFAAMNGIAGLEGLNDKINNIIKDLNLLVTNEVKEAVTKFTNQFVPAWKHQLKVGRKTKAKNAKEPTAQIYNYDESMNEFLEPWLEQYNELVSKYGEAFEVAFTYKMFLGAADVKRRNLLFPPEMVHKDVYKAYMESWESIFFAKDNNTGEDIVSSEKGKTTAQQRVPDAIQTDIRCIE